MHVPIPNDVRCQIYHWHSVLGKTVDEIHDELVNLPNQSFTLTKDWLKRIITSFGKKDFDPQAWMTSAQIRTGRKRVMNSESNEFLTTTTLAKKTKTLQGLAKDVSAEFDIPPPSTSTVFRELKRDQISRKVAEHRNILRDDVAGAKWCNRVAWVDPMDCIDIDGTSNSRETFLCKYGRSKIGEPCVLPQIRIGSKSYSTLAACSPLGFIAWRIFEIPVTSEMFCEYLTEVLEPHIIRGRTVCFIDNAAIHKTELSLLTLEEIFDGLFYLSPAYSPHFKPIEHAFKLIKDYIRDHEQEALADPVAFIHHAFSLYGVGGERAGSVRGCWDQYFNLHAMFAT